MHTKHNFATIIRRLLACFYWSSTCSAVYELKEPIWGTYYNVSEMFCYSVNFDTLELPALFHGYQIKALYSAKLYVAPTWSMFVFVAAFLCIGLWYSLITSSLMLSLVDLKMTWVIFMTRWIWNAFAIEKVALARKVINDLWSNQFYYHSRTRQNNCIVIWNRKQYWKNKIATGKMKRCLCHYRVPFKVFWKL